MATPEPNLQRSAAIMRRLTATDLGVAATQAKREHASNRPDDPPMLDNDPRFEEVVALLDRFGGVIFTGPPGTSKTWYAAKIGSRLVDEDEERIRFVQFHPSYQYEDFMQGYVPTESGDGFTLADKHFVAMCREADKHRDQTFVLVIDELSRGDPGRVFGEALTYVEKSKRDLWFKVASGDSVRVPPNLVVLATMNPLDRGVDEVDAAFERRFAKIAMEPDREILAVMLERNGIPPALQTRIIRFFNKVNGYARTTPQAALGQTFFSDVLDEADLRSVWDHQIRFLIEKAYRLDPDTRDELAGAFEAIFEPDDEPEVAEAASSPNEDV